MFVDEFLKLLKQNQTFASFSFEGLGFEALCVHGKFCVELFSVTKIVFGFKKHKLFVYGKNLELKNFEGTSVVVCGNIVCVSKNEVNFG